MITFSLQSGSNGNSIYVEAAGVRLLFDAGISARQARQRMAAHGRDIADVDALIISHSHQDHVRCAGVFHRLFRFPMYMTPRTHQLTRFQLGRVHDVRHFAPGDRLEFGAVTVHTLRTPHDAPETVVFIIEADGRRLGIFTDLGHPFRGLAEALADVHAAYLESNYDPQMLETGPYPPALKERIRGGAGHLSNGESADLVDGCGRHRPRWLALAHLSEQNNTPQLALCEHRTRIGRGYPLFVAGRYEVSDLLSV